MLKLKSIFVVVVVPLTACISLPACADEAPVSLVWTDDGANAQGGGYENVFVIKNTSAQPLAGAWSIYFSQLPRGKVVSQTADINIEVVNGNFFRIYPSPNMRTLLPQDSIVFRYTVEGSTPNISQVPEGCYWVADATDRDAQPLVVDLSVVVPANMDKQSLSAESIYAANTPIDRPLALSETDILPSVKQVEMKSTHTRIPTSVSITYDRPLLNEALLLRDKLAELYDVKVAKDAPFNIHLRLLDDASWHAEQYTLDLDDGRITIAATTPHGVFNGTQTLLALLKGNNIRRELTCLTIADYPDLDYRGWMCDVARNFTPADKLKKIVDVLSSYKINTLHLHLTDDEGWRLAIPGLEELTTVGARRGHTLDEAECLYPGYDGNFDPNANSTGNGFYSKGEFVDLLRYAARRHVEIIPEIECPGHARAAIVAMKARYNRLVGQDVHGAEEYLLSDPNDTSEYLSAQDYTDDVMNVAMPSCYRFIEKVISEIRAMYREAGLTLTTIHIGGDEVADGAWMGSPICQQFMKEHHIATAHALKEYFYCSLADSLMRDNIKIGGWQEMTYRNDAQTDDKLKEITSAVYCWNNSPVWGDDVIPYNMANNGFPIVLCSANCLYLDMAYNDLFEERGLSWAGPIDESKGFSFLPFSIYRSFRPYIKENSIDVDSLLSVKPPLREKQNIKGMQAQLFAETIRGHKWVEYYIFPKIFGLVERAWNAHPKFEQESGEAEQKMFDEELSRFEHIIGQKELPYLASLDVNFRLPNPGLLLKDGLLYANSSIPNVEIRYTTDGSEPDRHSPLWIKPIACRAECVKAKVFYLGRESLTTSLSPRR